MSTHQENTKKGAAAIYVVIFTATLLSIISLSFVRLMLSETGRTTNYSLSQSAYNSALAGIEDAKILLLRYQNCVNNAGKYKVNGVDVGCTEIINQLRGNASAAAENCDLVGNLLKYNTDTEYYKQHHETLIKTNSDSDEVTGSAVTFDQAYTCVKVSTRNKNYLTTLTKKYPTKIIPLRTDSQTSTNSVNRIVLSWFSRQDLSTVVKDNSVDVIKDEFHDFSKTPKMQGVIKNNNAFQSDDEAYNNTFTEKAVVPSVIQATLIQTATSFKLSQFYSAQGDATNRGSITLRPTISNVYDGVTTTASSNHIGGASFAANGGPFANSARKSQNTPLDVHCFIADGITTTSGYACTADIHVPRPISTSTGYSTASTREYTTFFLVLNLPYGNPNTEVSVEMMKCANNSLGIYAEDNCTNVDFVDVQPIIDATGRANDLFRRVEARIELNDTYFPIVNYALAVNDPNSDNDYVNKDFYVTNNCKYQESSWSASEGKVINTNESCPNSQYR